MLRSLSLLALSLLTAAPAAAQDALGAGDALDANPRVGSDGRNPAAAQPDYRVRNLLVTGDVAGGREFRGSVGYTAARDFRGATGSDSTFRFRAESAYSSPAAIISGLSSARLNTGYLPDIEYRRDTTVPSSVEFPRWNADRWNARQTTRRDVERLNSSLRDSSDSQMVGLIISEEGDLLRYAASSVRGIEVAPVQADAMSAGLTYYDRARIRQDVLADRSLVAPGIAFDPRTADRIDVRQPNDPIDTSVPPDGREARPGERPKSPYEEVVERLARQAGESRPVTDPAAPTDGRDASEPESRDRLYEELQELRRRLAPEQDDTRRLPSNRLNSDRTTPDQGTDQTPGQYPGQNPGQNPAQNPGANPPDPSTTGDAAPERASVMDRYAHLLRNAGDLNSLTPQEQNRLNELLGTGEQFLREARYFDARERFDRAVRLTPQHPLAMMGLANAELGAGLHRSAVLTLRTLYRSHPEMIDVSVDRALLPREDRLTPAIQGMRSRLANDPAASGFGLLLAYVGRQTGDRALITEGLSALRKSAGDEPLAELLESIWLTPAATPAAPQPVNTPAPEPDRDPGK